MQFSQQSRLPTRLYLAGQFACWFAISIAILTLVGWALGLGVLASLRPGGVAMNPLTAICFILAGLSLWQLGRHPAQRPTHPWSRRTARLAAAVVAVLGLVRISELVGGWHVGLDQVLFRAALEAAPGGWLNRMSPNSALNFILIGAAILLLDLETRRGRRPAQYLALATGAIALLALVGHLYGVSSFYAIAVLIPRPLNTASCFLLLSAAVLFLRPEAGLMANFAAPTYSGSVARRLLPVAIGLPVLLGWLRWEGQSAGFYRTATGIALYTTSMIVILGLAVWMTAHWLEQADRQRRQAEQELDNVFSLSLDLLCIAGFDGYFKRLNPAWEKTLGYSPHELMARPYLDFVHPDDADATRTEAEKIAAGVTTLSFENRYRARDGSYRWLLWTATPDPAQALIYAAARDISDRKQAEAELLELNRELEAFTYSVSHDLRAPLRQIDGFSQMLVEDFGANLPEEAQRYLARIRAGTRQMGELVDDLLNLARVGRQELRLQVTGLNSLAEEVRRELRAELEGRQVQWEIGSLPYVECDPALMKQVFANLLSNALKFTRPRSPARIQVGQLDLNGQPAVFVRDNGVGFSMKYAGKLFGVFQRFHRPEDFEGTGVGLATVQRIIHKHRGRVWAEAELDKGATFYFSLPSTSESGPAPPAPTER
jgi:PAS domain S-box-containing protein